MWDVRFRGRNKLIINGLEIELGVFCHSEGIFILLLKVIGLLSCLTIAQLLLFQQIHKLFKNSCGYAAVFGDDSSGCGHFLLEI